MFISKLNVQFNKCGKRESKKKMNRIQNCIAHHPLILLCQRIPVQIRMFVSKVRGLTGNWTHTPLPLTIYQISCLRVVVEIFILSQKYDQK